MSPAHFTRPTQPTQSAQSAANTRRKIFFINLLPIILITLNLRAPITSVAPVVDSVREYYALNAAFVGLLTSLPLLAFGLVSFFVSYFQPVRAMFVGLLCILLGEIVRCMGGSMELFIGTAIMGSGIAVANVLLPSLIKAKFPREIPKIMGIYSLVLNLSATLGIVLILPLMGLLSVPLALSSWAILAIAAIISYLPQMSNRRISRPKIKSPTSGTLFANPNAWKVTLFMGLCSTIAYSFFAWYPSFLISFGFSAHFASQMMILAHCVLVPVAFFAPLMLGSLPSSRRIYLIIFTCGTYIACFSLLLLSQQLWVVVLVSVLIGIPVGGVFGIALLFISIKSANVQTATKLSAMAQGVGYLIAALSPVMIGKIYDHFHHFTPALLALLGLAFLLNLIGYLAYKSPPIHA